MTTITQTAKLLKAVWVGGPKSGRIFSKTRDFYQKIGIDIIRQVDSDNFVIPPSTDIVLINTDNVSHKHNDKAIAICKKQNIKFCFVSNSNFKSMQQLAACGIKLSPIPQDQPTQTQRRLVRPTAETMTETKPTTPYLAKLFAELYETDEERANLAKFLEPELTSDLKFQLDKTLAKSGIKWSRGVPEKVKQIKVTGNIFNVSDLANFAGITYKPALRTILFLAALGYVERCEAQPDRKRGPGISFYWKLVKPIPDDIPVLDTLGSKPTPTQPSQTKQTEQTEQTQNISQPNISQPNISQPTQTQDLQEAINLLLEVVDDDVAEIIIDCKTKKVKLRKVVIEETSFKLS